uniref:Uncharacterized protein n=1 Tax=Anopheles atroparvus TaxID=41427 RepID=A0AAG5D674_ANOAO
FLSFCPFFLFVEIGKPRGLLQREPHRPERRRCGHLVTIDGQLGHAVNIWIFIEEEGEVAGDTNCRRRSILGIGPSVAVSFPKRSKEFIDRRPRSDRVRTPLPSLRPALPRRAVRLMRAPSPSSREEYANNEATSIIAISAKKKTNQMLQNVVASF